jgi:GTPase Era involved in 16S rRNA processing
VPNAEIYPISALQNFNVPKFSKNNFALPESPAYYPKDQLTDKPERFFVNETILRKYIELQQGNSICRRNCNRSFLKMKTSLEYVL